MAKKEKKKLAKYNKVVREIFDGDSFDEGVARLPLDNLIELAQLLGLRPPSLHEADLVREFRRLWSEADVTSRSVIVDYLQGLGQVFSREEFLTAEEKKKQKIREILHDLGCTTQEEAILLDSFMDKRLKKITPEAIQKKLDSLRIDHKKSQIEKRLDGSFDAEGSFEFYHSFHFSLFGEAFGKILAVRTKPVDLESFKTIPFSELLAQMSKEKSLAIAQKEKKIADFLSWLTPDHPYLKPKEMIEAIKTMQPDGDIEAIELNDKVVMTILKKSTDLYKIEPLAKTFLLYKEGSFNLFGHDITYLYNVAYEKTYLYRDIWEAQPFSIMEDLNEELRRTQTMFRYELNALFDALYQDAEELGLTREQVQEFIADRCLAWIKREQKLELPPNLVAKISEEFEKKIEASRLKRQREELLARTIRDFKNLFPLARKLKRKLVFHMGPTNSGKTYHAMQELIHADTGYYLAPLRLLALEGYESLLKAGLSASLITGEEQIIDEEAAHISSTIEMVNFNVEVDVAVIDEVQMIADPDRGWAWANAIIGVPASKVIMTGSSDALRALEAMAKWLGEPLEVILFQRKNELVVLQNPTPIKKIEPKTAIVAFSRAEVLSLKQQLAQWYKVSVVYGNLSPEVRREEARRFREGETEILVATDAIAMGLNLPIKTILFARDSKFDGQKRRLLSTSEILQIAGRAGRYGYEEKGYVGALSSGVLSTIRDLFDNPLSPIEPPFNVMANLDHIQLVAEILETDSLGEIIRFFAKHMRFDGPFRAAQLESMLEIARIVDMYRLDLKSKYHLACAPISTSSPYIEQAFHRYVVSLEKKEAVKYIPPPDLPEFADTMEMLLEAEDRVREISLYLWLSFRFPDYFPDSELAKQTRVVLNTFIENSLKVGQFFKKCRICGKKMPLSYEFDICQRCYNKRLYSERGVKSPPLSRGFTS